MKTLPDYLEAGLDIVFVGINPGEYSARVGRYFANPLSRFWDAVNQSGLFDETLDFESDYRVLEYGIGLTDVVKRPTSSPKKLRAADYRQRAPVFKGQIERVSPLIVCFLGKTACYKYLKYGEGVDSSLAPGVQDWLLGCSKVFLIPHPSPANRGDCSDDELIWWFKRLKLLRDQLKGD